MKDSAGSPGETAGPDQAAGGPEGGRDEGAAERGGRPHEGDAHGPEVHL